jgi:2-C-methyl-D-erythritol 2,4-cyclodiphosphate synthase
MDIRIGQGIDFHRLENGLDLWLGGVKIDSDKGCVAHSDGDVLLHAICDALLGAAGLGDIGFHFPDNSEEYRGIDSKILLKKTFDLLSKEGYTIKNIDSTVCLQKPKIAPYVPQMKETVAGILGLDPGSVSVKATTTEKMGFVGKEKGIVALASALIFRTQS